MGYIILNKSLKLKLRPVIPNSERFINYTKKKVEGRPVERKKVFVNFVSTNK